MVEKVIGEFVSSSDIEMVIGRREKLLRKIGRFCTEVAVTSTYEAEARQPHRLVGSSAEYVYPPQPVNEVKDSHLVISSDTDPRLRVDALRHDYDNEKVKGYFQVNFGIIEDQAYLGVQTHPEKSDVPAVLAKGIRKIFATIETDPEGEKYTKIL